MCVCVCVCEYKNIKEQGIHKDDFIYGRIICFFILNHFFWIIFNFKNERKKRKS